MRWFRHLVDSSPARRHFPAPTLDAVQHAIAASERRHLGEVCFAVEGRLAFGDVLRGRTARDRAEEVFAHLRVWDTTRNTGVLVYILLADHAIEIIADRAVAASVDQTEWDAVCALMQKHFVAGAYQAAAIAGVEAISAILVREFPSDGTSNSDELGNRPVIL